MILPYLRDITRIAWLMTKLKIRAALGDTCAVHGVKWDHGTHQYVCECGRALAPERTGDRPDGV